MRHSSRLIAAALALSGTPLALPTGAAPAPPGEPRAARPEGIAWTDWSPAVFDRAKREHRLVLLDLGAVWCHWCHVMEETTYREPRVIELLGTGFLPVRVDQDARPDLSNRYEDYGWPATVIFDADGAELVKFSGYIPPLRMISLLEGVIADPTPGPSVQSATGAVVESEAAGKAALDPALRASLETQLATHYDAEHGGWGFAKKFMDWDAVEYSMLRARAGDGAAEKRARETLAGERRLVDPVWGGLYQYSDSGDWDHPHFEKIMAFQSETMRVFSMAWSLWRDPADLQAARDLHRYLRAFLMSPEGAFYVSQDADLVAGEHGAEYFALDDAGRRRRGVPRVDTHVYARETAWAAVGLVALHSATGDEPPLAEAATAARWVLAHRALPGGGFRHDGVDVAGPYLGDTLAAGRAFLALYAATADRSWLGHAEAAVAFIDRTFRPEAGAGYATAKAASRIEPARPLRDEMIGLARLANLLFRYTGKPEHRQVAERALRFLAVPEVAKRVETGGVLLADLELRSEPLHVTVVGRRDDPAARALLAEALREPAAYKRVELLDERDGPLPNADVAFPHLGRAAAFLCTAGRCSAPAFTAEELRARAARAAGSHLVELGVDARRETTP
jgi:uncharacterized protein